jgi:hypothetical protein
VTTQTKAPVIKGRVEAGEMQPRNRSHRHALMATVPFAVLLAACGTTAATSTHSSSPRPTPTATTLIPTPSPTAVPTSAPEPRLALFFAYSGAMAVFNSQGVEQWSLTNAQEGQLFGLTAEQASTYNLGPQSGNSNLFFFYQASPTSPNQVVVLSRTGELIGKGTAPALASPGSLSYSLGSFQVSPTGTEWAWSVDQTPNATGQHQGYIEVGGLGIANRILYRWVAPIGFAEQVVGWTDTGIIMQRVQDGPCGTGGGEAWFTINPSTGKLSQLVPATDRMLDASSGVIAAAPTNDPHSVSINGVTYSESKSVVYGALISPDGAHVAVGRESFNPCGGGAIPTTSLELVTLANRSHIDIANLQIGGQIGGWWGNDEFVASPPDNSPPPPGANDSENSSTWIYNLQGKPVSQICPVNTQWIYQGALS